MPVAYAIIIKTVPKFLLLHCPVGSSQTAGEATSFPSHILYVSVLILPHLKVYLQKCSFPPCRYLGHLPGLKTL